MAGPYGGTGSRTGRPLEPNPLPSILDTIRQYAPGSGRAPPPSDAPFASGIATPGGTGTPGVAPPSIEQFGGRFGDDSAAGAAVPGPAPEMSAFSDEAMTAATSGFPSSAAAAPAAARPSIAAPQGGGGGGGVLGKVGTWASAMGAGMGKYEPTGGKLAAFLSGVGGGAGARREMAQEEADKAAATAERERMWGYRMDERGYQRARDLIDDYREERKERERLIEAGLVSEDTSDKIMAEVTKYRTAVEETQTDPAIINQMVDDFETGLWEDAKRAAGERGRALRGEPEPAAPESAPAAQPPEPISGGGSQDDPFAVPGGGEPSDALVDWLRENRPGTWFAGPDGPVQIPQ